jgi:hypothetical protein
VPLVSAGQAFAKQELALRVINSVHRRSLVSAISEIPNPLQEVLEIDGSETSVRDISYNENVSGTVEADETRQVGLIEPVVESALPIMFLALSTNVLIRLSLY